MSPRAYVWTVLALCATFVVPAVGLNLALLSGGLSVDKNRLASEWQQATHGVTYAPPISRNRPFKALRLADRIVDVNTVVFGSSTTMGIVEGVFPPPLKSYNFAQSGNSLGSMLGEAEYVVEHWGGRIRMLVIPLDWALGFVYEAGDPTEIDLSPDAVLREAAVTQPSLRARFVDALSAPRMKILYDVLRDLFRQGDVATAFRQVFIEPSGPDYRCADGTMARDFDVVHRGICNGFRFDGSATFADQKRLDAGRAPSALAAAVSGGGQYAAALRRGRGKPNPVFLEKIALLARRMEARGGRIVVLMPPLMPGMENALAATSHSGEWLRATKDAIRSWSEREHIILLDAGRSERYGCLPAEFIDPHHALPGCYGKIFSRFFHDHPGLPAGGTGNR